MTMSQPFDWRRDPQGLNCLGQFLNLLGRAPQLWSNPHVLEGTNYRVQLDQFSGGSEDQDNVRAIDRRHGNFSSCWSFSRNLSPVV
jgi:hypothetical protein